jgi:hypothetical protein
MKPTPTKEFRVKAIIDERLAARKRGLEQRLDRNKLPADRSRPVLQSPNVQFELAGRGVGTAYGGLALVQQLVQRLGLAQAIDARLHLFKVHLPYHESDHVLNLAYNALCAGRALEDLELRRQDEAYLDLLGAERIPDPTTAGDFCRRFTRADVQALHEAYDVARRQVWSQQPPEFFAEARIEADGTMVETAAECKQGADINYQGRWGYHPLVLTLANTGEVLRLVNRGGNRPSHEGAAEQFDQCLDLCRAAGFEKILLRGDTDFSQTAHLDRWHAQGDVRFVFGLDVTAGQHVDADDLPASAWKPLKRPAKTTTSGPPRARPARVKQRIVEQRGFKDIRLVDEEVAERPYRPTACRTTYRLVIVRKNLEVSEQGVLFADYRYFLYLTNDWRSTPEQIVFSANQRCQQENVLAQLKDVRALHAPVDNLTSNEAYMVMTSLAWNLKAWLALSLPESDEELNAELNEPSSGGGAKQAAAAAKQRLLGLEFRTFVNSFMRLPAQVVKTGRRIVVRLLAWNAWLPEFFRLAERLRRPAPSYRPRC